MTCATCGHTLHSLGNAGRRDFWCPRCGSLVTEYSYPGAPTRVETQPPKLVERVRAIPYPWAMVPLDDVTRGISHAKEAAYDGEPT